jgi:hypothetical protein
MLPFFLFIFEPNRDGLVYPRAGGNHMKKIAIAVGVSLLALAGTVSADESKMNVPMQGNDAVAQGYEWDATCREGIQLQEQRIRDLRASIDFDKDVEQKLIAGVVARERDAGVKEEHARRWREHANHSQDQGKKDAFGKFASWLETEARTDRAFASERREALRVINRQWNQAANAIAGHERQLADMRSFCGS